VDIYRYGRWLSGSQAGLGNSDNTASTGDVWVPFTFSVGRSGVSFVDAPETLTRGWSDADDELDLPEEFFDKDWLYDM
ncbi:MAG: hypothetical protein LC725_04095, partial [Lentisphaerae bacterium]|nr:hypothetical protein [Lentisphaerota bacterium]